MRKLCIGITTLGAMLCFGDAQANRVPPFKGNDVGGIIAWSPEAHRFRHEIAADHCASWGKLHRITSVHPWYGDYIGFSCYWARGTDGIILRRAY
jgi:hypothetical protein